MRGKVGVGDATGWRMSCENGVTTHEGIGSGLGEGGLNGLCPSCQMISPSMVGVCDAKVQMASLMGTLKMAADQAIIAAWTIACSVLSYCLRRMTRIGIGICVR
jgi:hypothetical protein